MKAQTVLLLHSDVIVRRAFSQVLERNSNISVHSARLSTEPKSVIRDLSPDIVFLEVSGDDNDALEQFNEIREQFPALPVVVISERTESGGTVAVEALLNGALDFVTKPEHNNSLLFAERHLMKRIPPVVNLVARDEEKKRYLSVHHSLLDQFDKNRDEPLDSFWPLQLIVIGSCTGGPAALERLFESLPGDLPVPILVVQHFPQIYTGILARELNRATALKVREAADRDKPEAGSVYIVPGGRHCDISQQGNQLLLNIHRGPRHLGLRPSIDVTFRSAGQVLGPGVLGIILSGHGTDGVAGARIIQQDGGQVIVQDPETTLACEMPCSVIEAGFCDGVYPLEMMTDILAKRTQKSDESSNSDWVPIWGVLKI